MQWWTGLDFQHPGWLIVLYAVLIIWFKNTAKNSVVILLPLGLLVITTLGIFCGWVFGMHYATIWLGILALDFLSLLGVMSIEKNATNTSGASGWITFAWLILHIQLITLLMLGKGACWLWPHVIH